MDLLDTHHLRSDIVNRLLGGEEDEQTTPFLDRLVEIAEMENDCEKKLMNERFEIFERMKSLKNGRTLLKGYGRSPRIKPKLKGSI